MCPCDRWLFPNNPTLFLTTATANGLGTWIASGDKSSTETVEVGANDKGMDRWQAVEVLLCIQFGTDNHYGYLY